MIEKRNRNGGTRREGREEPDEDEGAEPDESAALKAPETPTRKPSVEPAPPAESASRPQGGRSGTRLLLLLLVIAAAATVAIGLVPNVIIGVYDAALRAATALMGGA